MMLQLKDKEKSIFLMDDEKFNLLMDGRGRSPHRERI